MNYKYYELLVTKHKQYAWHTLLAVPLSKVLPVALDRLQLKIVPMHKQESKLHVASHLYCHIVNNQNFDD